MLEELEYQRRRDLIRSVGDTEIEKWQLSLDCISLDQLEFVLIAKLVDTLADLGDHSRIDFNCDSLFASLQ